MTVLVVDDSSLIRVKVIELLQEVNGITSVRACAAYNSAVSELGRKCPTIAIIDIKLKGKTGIELLHYVKHTCPATTVIMLTNQFTDDYKRVCLNMGAAYFLDKSNDFHQLPHILSGLQ